MDDLSFIGMTVDRLNFETSTALAIGLSDRVASELSVAVNERGQAVLAVSGEPQFEIFFYYLAKADIPWQNITITTVDERYVPITSERSNERFIRAHLLQHNAAKARFVGLYNKTITAELAAFSAASRVNNLAKPFDAVILSMGDDGHIASLIKGGDRLKQALDPQSRALVLPIHAKGLSEARLTMTLPLLTSGRFIAIHIEGQATLSTFEQALLPGDEQDMPIRAVLNHATQPVQVYWSPTSENREPIVDVGE